MFLRSACRNHSRLLLSVSRALGTSTSVVAENTAPFLEEGWQKSSPVGFQYAWLPEADTVTVVPHGWYTAREFGEDRSRYIISKEDALTNKEFSTGYTISQWKCDLIPPATVMDQVAAHHLGIVPSRYISKFLAYGTKQNVSYNLTFLKELDILLLDYKKHNVGNLIHRKSTEFIKLQPNTGDDTYVVSHVLALVAEKKVLSFVFECPVSQQDVYKPLVGTVLDYSALACTSKNRVIFSDVLTPNKETPNNHVHKS